MTARNLAFLVLLGALLLTTGRADAKGRFERGRNLVQQRCAPCLAMGWVWAPTAPDPKRPHALATYAKTWSPAQVCTWMRRQTRKTTGPACYPGHIPERDRLDMLFYLHRRAQGPILAPKLQRPAAFRIYKGKPLKRTLAERRSTVEQQRRAQAELDRMRRLSNSRFGEPRRPIVPARPAPAPRGRR